MTKRFTPMSLQELRVIIRPDGLLLEWTDTDAWYDEPSRHLQQELFRRYHAEPDTWLLWLSFADPNVQLAPTLAFWRNIAVRFAEKLAHLPDLEEVRDNATVVLEDDDVKQWLAIAPMCPGMEYLNHHFLLQVWSSLHDIFRRLIRAYEGTVEAFIHTYRPDLQLAGRIFFHLVEHTKGDAPFAFLATYSTHMGGDGTARAAEVCAPGISRQPRHATGTARDRPSSRTRQHASAALAGQR